jgi:hypothetical protein
MENLYRMMYELQQQDYFTYLHQVAVGAPTIMHQRSAVSLSQKW